MRLCSPPGRMRDREGGRVCWEGGRWGGEVRKMEETRMDALKYAGVGKKGGQNMR